MKIDVVKVSQGQFFDIKTDGYSYGPLYTLEELIELRDKINKKISKK